MTFSHGAAMVFDRGSRPASIPAFVLAILFTLITAVPAAALSLLRDADIEHGLTQLAAPVLRAAGLSPARVRVLVVNESSLNAFVVDRQTIFLHYGLIQKLDSAAALQAVIAHEAAHIANGHIARRMGNMRSARNAAGLGLALAAVAAAAGGGEAAGGIAAGTASSAQRLFLAHTRAEEASADRAAAGYLHSAGIGAQGLVELHETFRGQEVLSVARQDPYTRSHPLTRDRIRAAKALAAAGGKPRPDPQADYWFARLRGKLSAFTRAPKWTLRRAGAERFADVRAMREAVAWHRRNDLPRALQAMDAALAARPRDAYYHDLRGQILLENRQTEAALAAYKAAVALAPREPLILGGYGRAQLAAGRPAAALVTLDRARAGDFRDTRVLRDLAVAYARTDQTGMAVLITAERYALMGRMRDAGQQAQRAVGLLPRGSAAWQSAQDVVNAAEQFEKRNR